MSTSPSPNQLFVFTAPSGSGKTTVVRHLLKTFDSLSFSISATTRRRREHEKHGRDYYFVSAETFRMWVDDDAFVEWEEVYKNQFYGTLRFELERLWDLGKNVIFDIDVKGALSIRKQYPENTRSVFIKVPSADILKERLRQRHTETEQSLQKRLKRVKEELKYEHEFDTVLTNDDLHATLQNAEHLISKWTGEPVPK